MTLIVKNIVLGIDAEKSASYMRMLTLCTYPTGFDEISYDDIKNTLQVPEEDVEKWVVKAITSNLIQAKIDQLKKSVIITRCMPRGFGSQQWSDLQTKINLYKANVGSLLETIRAARIRQANK